MYEGDGVLERAQRERFVFSSFPPSPRLCLYSSRDLAPIRWDTQKGTTVLWRFIMGKRWTYTREFKQEAVGLLKQAERSVAQVAKDLGIS